MSNTTAADPFFFRNALRVAHAEERMGASSSLTAKQLGFKDTAELAEAAREEGKRAKPKKLVDAEREAQRLQQQAGELAGQAAEIRSKVEQDQIELDRDTRLLHVAKSALAQFEQYASGIDAAISSKTEYLCDPNFQISTFEDGFGQNLRVEEDMLDAITKLRLRKELVPAQRAAFAKRVAELEKRTK